MEWQPIATAPKGGGAATTTDPAWVDPPAILMYFPRHGQCVVCHWDWYYAEGGHGYRPDVPMPPWIEPTSGEFVQPEYGPPSHWMTLPDPPSWEAVHRDWQV